MSNYTIYKYDNPRINIVVGDNHMENTSANRKEIIAYPRT